MELYSVKYAYNFKYANEKSIFADSITNNEISNFVFQFYIICCDEKYYLVDTGFREKKIAEDFGIVFIETNTGMKKITKGKELVGIIITHDHFDHTGNIDLYKNINIYMNELEHNEMINDENRKNVNCNLRILEFKDEFDVNENIKIKHIGGHTIGSSIVYVKNNAENYVIVGDECYLRRNIDEDRPIGNYYNKERNREFINELQKSNIKVLINHDGTELTKYKEIEENIYKIF